MNDGLGWCPGYIEGFNINFPNDYNLLEVFKPESDVDEEEETEGSE